jgi:hypothetical protein
MKTQQSIPVAFVPAYLAVNEATAIEMLGLNDGRSERAQKDAFKRIRDIYEIKALPGFVFSLRQLERAMDNP